MTEQQCPTCDRKFKQLNKHKCKTVAAADTAQSQCCATCGKTFKKLSSHKCKTGSQAVSGAAAQVQNHVQARQRPDPQFSICPQCRQGFDHRTSHCCKEEMIVSRTLNPAQVWENQSSKTDLSYDAVQLCLNCGQQVPTLLPHRCLGREAAAADRDEAREILTECLDCGERCSRARQHVCSRQAMACGSYAATWVRANDALDLCLGCGQKFKRLSMHKCKNVEPTSTSAENILLVTASATKSSEQTCPTCKKIFKRLDMHKCKALGIESAQKTTMENTNPHGKEPCPSCGKMFLRLSMHKCKDHVTADRDVKNKNPAPERPVKDQAQKQPTTPPSSLSNKALLEDNTGTDNHFGRSPSFQGYSERHDKSKAAFFVPPDITPSASSSSGFYGRPHDPHHPASSSSDFCGRSPGIDRPPSTTFFSNSSVASSSPEEEAEALMEELQLRRSSNPRHDLFKFFSEEVVLQQEEKRTASTAFRNLQRKILEQLNKQTEWTWEHFNSGSAYDGTKVTRADEIDCMLVPKLPRNCLSAVLENAPPGYCFVQFHGLGAALDESKQAQWAGQLAEFCEQQTSGDCFLRSDQFRSHIHDVVKAAINEERKAQVDPSYNPMSPSLVVNLKAIPFETGLREVLIDLVPALHLDSLPKGTLEDVLDSLPPQDAEQIVAAGFDVVPKHFTGDAFRAKSHLLWRLSFSRAEKQLTKFADLRTKTWMQTPSRDYPTGGKQKPTCRKEVLRILKRLLEVIKGFNNSKKGWKNPVVIDLQKASEALQKRQPVKDWKFTAFEIRTLLLWEFYSTCPGPEKWTTDSRRERVQHALQMLRKMTRPQQRSMTVPHFFLRHVIPDVMVDVPPEERDFLCIMFSVAEKLL